MKPKRTYIDYLRDIIEHAKKQSVFFRELGLKNLKITNKKYSQLSVRWRLSVKLLNISRNPFRTNIPQYTGEEPQECVIR